MKMMEGNSNNNDESLEDVKEEQMNMENSIVLFVEDAISSSCLNLKSCRFCHNSSCTIGSQVAQLVVDVQKLQASLSNLRKSTALKVRCYCSRIGIHLDA